MALVRLTSQNLSALKAHARRAFPTTRSSHLTEALAAGLGFRTHATLLAALSAHGHTPLARTAEDAFRARLAELAAYEPANSKAVTLSSVVRDAALPHPCWRSIRKKDLAGINAWFAECRRDNIPNVWLSPARSYATLEWDCIALDGRADEAIRGKGSKDTVRHLFDFFQTRVRGAPGKPIFFGSAFVGDIAKLLPATAEALADDYFEFLYTVTRPSKAAAAQGKPAHLRRRGRRAI